MEKSKRGFAAMSPEKRKAVAAKGGASVPSHKRCFARDKALAARAGSAGGKARGRTRNGIA